MIVVKSLGQQIGDQVKNAVEFFRLFKSLVIEFVLHLGVFVKILFDIIKETLGLLVANFEGYCTREKDKLKRMISSLLILSAPLGFKYNCSFRECQNIVDQIGENIEFGFTASGMGSYMEMETVQIKGVDSTIRTTKGILEKIQI